MLYEYILNSCEALLSKVDVITFTDVNILAIFITNMLTIYMKYRYSYHRQNRPDLQSVLNKKLSALQSRIKDINLRAKVILNISSSLFHCKQYSSSVKMSKYGMELLNSLHKDQADMSIDILQLYLQMVYINSLSLIIDNSEMSERSPGSSGPSSQFEMMMRAETLLVHGLSIIQDRLHDDKTTIEKYTKLISKVGQMIGKLGESSLKLKRNPASIRIKNSIGMARNNSNDNYDTNSIERTFKVSRKSTPEGSNASNSSRRIPKSSKMEARSEKGLITGSTKQIRYSKFKKPPEPHTQPLKSNQVKPYDIYKYGSSQEKLSRNHTKSFKINRAENYQLHMGNRNISSKNKEYDNKEVDKMKPKLITAKNKDRKERNSLNLSKLGGREDSIDLYGFEQRNERNAQENKLDTIKLRKQSSNKVSVNPNNSNNEGTENNVNLTQGNTDKAVQVSDRVNQISFTDHDIKGKSQTSLYESTKDQKIVSSVVKTNPNITFKSELQTKRTLPEKSRESSKNASQKEKEKEVEHGHDLECDTMSRNSSTYNTSYLHRGNSISGSLGTKKRGR